MPEWGQLPIPQKLLARGVTDMVRISDARMSGTAFGTVVLHVAPEAAAGGPLAAVRDGDPIVLDVDARRLDLDVPDDEIERRARASSARRAPKYRRGYGALYLEHVLQADEGCDFDFLRGPPGEPAEREPDGTAQRLDRGDGIRLVRRAFPASLGWRARYCRSASSCSRSSESRGKRSTR